MKQLQKLLSDIGFAAGRGKGGHTSMMERHEEWSNLAPMYVLGGLEGEEVVAFEPTWLHVKLVPRK